jgi:hypothetical protein
LSPELLIIDARRTTDGGQAHDASLVIRHLRKSYVPGTPVNAAGSYELLVSAEDLAGNDRQLNFDFRKDIRKFLAPRRCQRS